MQTSDATATLVKGINHSSYTVTELDRVIAFFAEGFGFPLLSKEPREVSGMSHITGVPGADVITAFVQAPGGVIELTMYKQPTDKRQHDIRPCDDGFSHVAFDVYDIDAAVEVGARYGFQEVAEPLEITRGPNKGLMAVYLRDNYGLTFEFIGPRVR